MFKWSVVFLLIVGCLIAAGFFWQRFDSSLLVYQNSRREAEEAKARVTKGMPIDDAIPLLASTSWLHAICTFDGEVEHLFLYGNGDLAKTFYIAVPTELGTDGVRVIRSAVVWQYDYERCSGIGLDDPLPLGT